jgi:hypothetical protein
MVHRSQLRRSRRRSELSALDLSGLALLAIVAAACGKSGDRASTSSASSSANSAEAKSGDDDPSSSASTSSAPKPKGPRGPIDPAKTGTITGVVRFEGEPPERKPLPMSASGGCPEHTKPVFAEDVVVENGALANVLVHIKDGLSGWTLPPLADEPFEMDQKGCLYTPHVLGMRTGGKLLVKNSDPTTHNVNIRAQANGGANPIQPPGGKPVEWIPAKKELGVGFECNLHPWMRAWVCVVDDPWFAVTGADGSFTLAGVPPGDYVLEAWHEKYGKRTAKVSLDPGGKPTANFTFKPDR